MKKTISGRTVLGYSLTAELTFLDCGVHILLTGGTRTHVGAVSICGPGGAHTLELEHHRDGTVSERWAKQLYRIWLQPVTVACGIHYDSASKGEIREIVAGTEEMLSDMGTLIL